MSTGKIFFSTFIIFVSYSCSCPRQRPFPTLFICLISENNRLLQHMFFLRIISDLLLVLTAYNFWVAALWLLTNDAISDGKSRAGLENLHVMTYGRTYSLRMDLEETSLVKEYATRATVRVEDEDNWWAEKGPSLDRTLQRILKSMTCFCFMFFLSVIMNFSSSSRNVYICSPLIPPTLTLISIFTVHFFTHTNAFSCVIFHINNTFHS